MMKTQSCLLFLLLATTAVSAETASTTAPTTQPATQSVVVDVDPTSKEAVDAAMEKQVRVHATIVSAAWSASGKVLRIEFNGTEKSKFMSVAFTKLKKDLDAKFGGNATENLTGKAVVITGKLTPYKGRPEVILNDASQISLEPVDAR